MPFSILIDNWTLQDAGRLLSDGLTEAGSTQIVFSGDGYSYQNIPAGVVGLKALFQVINHLVFADSIVVDAGSARTWANMPGFRALQDKALITQIPFREDIDQWKPIREAIERKLCFSAELQKVHAGNKAAFISKKKQPDRMLSQLLWGGAGMLARAHASSLPYTTHPLRERLFQHAQLLTPPNAARDLEQFMKSERTKIYLRRPGREDESVYTEILLPPAVIEVIDAASSIAELMPAALAARDRYAKVRTWIGDYQQAMVAENLDEILSRQKTLRDLSRHFDSLVGSAEGTTSFDIGVSFQGVSPGMSFDPLRWLRVRIGVCAPLSQLVRKPPGRRALRKLLRLFGEEETALGLEVSQAFAGNV